MLRRYVKIAELNVKLEDFGLAKMVYEQRLSQGMRPHQLGQWDTLLPTKTDINGFGLVVLEMASAEEVEVWCWLNEHGTYGRKEK